MRNARNTPHARSPRGTSSSQPRTAQRGGFFIGLVVGLLVGLGVALGVALYVTKVPVPFIDKVPQRTAAQDAAEAVRNQDWDPNAPLAGKNPARPAGAASAVGNGVAPAASAASAVAASPAASVPSPAASKPGAARDPAAILGDKAAPAPAAASGADPFVYFVQAGAYARSEEAEAQRAKLAIRGFESRITEREQSGRTIYRVRIGPLETRAEAEGVQETLGGAGVESALVRVQK
jgi:cell division protein FtsN